jgi:hypothetical protein
LVAREPADWRIKPIAKARLALANIPCLLFVLRTASATKIRISPLGNQEGLKNEERLFRIEAGIDEGAGLCKKKPWRMTNLPERIIVTFIYCYLCLASYIGGINTIIVFSQKLAARVSDSVNFEPTACDTASASPIYYLGFRLDVII